MKLPTASVPLDVTLHDFVSGQKVFRRYTLKRVLGRGGMGVVWLAHDDELERDVALKFLPDLIILDRGMLANLKRETKRSLELTHKNIVRIYDFVNDETAACISMEYVDGDTLSNMRADREHKVFQTHELAPWVGEICEALDYAHNHARVVHRDLKPSNLMVNQRGNLKVADFGIARNLSDSVSMLTVGDHHTSGTLVYMSPQQLDGERGMPLDDIYSFGATMYELLTSKPPFYSGNIDRQVHERVPPPMGHRREELETESDPIEESWEQLVAACLQKDPARRPQSTKEITDFLTKPAPPAQARWFTFPASPKPRREPPTATQPITATAPPPPRVGKRRFRRAALSILAGGKAVLRGVGLGVEAVKEDFRSVGLFLIAVTKAIGRGIAAVIKAIGATLLAVVLISAKAVKAIGCGLAIGATAIVHDAARAITSIIHFADAATLLLGKAFKAGFRAGAAATVFLARETIRATAITIVPALAVAAGVWFFAVRVPPPKIVKAPATKTQLRPPPEVQPQPAAIESHVVTSAPVAAATAQSPAESKPPPTADGSLAVETNPPGATVIVDGSLIKTSPASFSSLAVGKHQLQFVLDGYVTEERETEIKEGQMTTLNGIALQTRTPPQIVEPVKRTPEKKTVAVKKTPPSPQRTPARVERSTSLPPRQAAAPLPSPPPPKLLPSPAPPRKTKEDRPRNPFDGTAPGG